MGAEPAAEKSWHSHPRRCGRSGARRSVVTLTLRGPGSMISRSRLVGDRGVAPRACRRDGRARPQAVELVPAGFLIGDDRRATGYRPACRCCRRLRCGRRASAAAVGDSLVVDEDLKARGLALDPALRILEVRDVARGHAVGPKTRIAELVAVLRQPGRRLRAPDRNPSSLLPSRAMPMPGWIL